MDCSMRWTQTGVQVGDARDPKMCRGQAMYAQTADVKRDDAAQTGAEQMPMERCASPEIDERGDYGPQRSKRGDPKGKKWIVGGLD